MMFSISFLNNPSPNSDSVIGQICVGGFTEKFESSLSFWSVLDYMAHWETAIYRVLRSNMKSCLITSITDPKKSNFIRWWPIYQDGENVILQNQLLFLDELENPFDVARPFDSVGPHCKFSEEGDKISEWKIKKTDLTLWFTNSSKREAPDSHF